MNKDGTKFFHFRPGFKNNNIPWVCRPWNSEEEELSKFFRHVAKVVRLTPSEMIKLNSKVVEQFSSMKPHTKLRGFTLAVTNDAFGVAMCSEHDNFNRKLGRTIALGRLNKKPIKFKV